MNSRPLAIITAEKAMHDFCQQWFLGLQPSLSLETAPDGEILVHCKVIAGNASRTVHHNGHYLNAEQAKRGKHRGPSYKRRLNRRAASRSVDKAVQVSPALPTHPPDIPVDPEAAHAPYHCLPLRDVMSPYKVEEIIEDIEKVSAKKLTTTEEVASKKNFNTKSNISKSPHEVGTAQPTFPRTKITEGGWIPRRLMINDNDQTIKKLTMAQNQNNIQKRNRSSITWDSINQRDPFGPQVGGDQLNRVSFNGSLPRRSVFDSINQKK